MIKKTILNCTLFVCLTIIVSCTSNEVDKTLDRIYEIADSDKPLALSLIDSLSKKQSDLSDFQRNRFIVYSTMVKDKNYVDISNDTLLFDAPDFFVQNGDNLHAALVYHYSARVQTVNNETEKAFSNFLKADNYIGKTKNSRMKAVIAFNLGNNCLQQQLYPNALFWYRKSLCIFTKIDDLKSVTSLYLNIANCHNLEAHTDSAYFYYNKGMKLANEINDQGLKYSIQSNLGALYQLNNKNEEAEKHYKNAISYSSSSLDSSRIYVYLSDLLISAGKQDSAKLYVERALNLVDPTNHDDLHLYCQIISMQSNWAELSGDYANALVYNREYTKSLYQVITTTKTNEILDIEQKYENEKLKREKTESIIAKQRTQLLGLILLLIASAVIVILYFTIRRHKNNLAEVELRIVQLTEIATKYQSEPIEQSPTNETVQLIMHKYFDILTKAALIEGYMKEDERTGGQKLLSKFNELVYGKNSFDWETFLITTNEMKNNVLERVKEKFSELDDVEYKIFCLAYCELTNMETSMIVGINVNTVKKKKLSVRKKLGITGYSNFIEEVNQLLAN